MTEKNALVDNEKECDANPHMCIQTESIAKFGESLTNIQLDLREALDKMETRDNKMMDILQTASTTSAQVLDLKEGFQQHNHMFEGIYTRLGNVESILGEKGATMDLKIEASVNKRMETIIKFISIITSKPSIIIATSLAVLTIVGTCFDLYAHVHAVKNLVDLYKTAK